mmetsp:Transcript_66224/g.110618  ORF Transcript_66224/g.110618 Transcript_66224/m.110618 type:complete len:224 (-) Transcript_66224:1414-2085(-)
MDPFSMETLSNGSPLIPHCRMVTGSVRLSSVKSTSTGMPMSWHCFTQSASMFLRYLDVKGPRYAMAPAASSMLPTRFSFLAPRLVTDDSHRTFSEDNPPISLPARSSRTCVIFISASKFFPFCTDSSYDRCSFWTFASIAARSACFSANFFLAASNFSSATANLAFLGATPLATLEYLSMARTQRHRDLHAVEVAAMISGVKFSSLIHFCSFLESPSGMLSLS